MTALTYLEKSKHSPATCSITEVYREHILKDLV